MKYKITSPGTCGEFIQGFLHNTPVLISCPINRFTTGIVNLSSDNNNSMNLVENFRAKSLKAYYATKKYYNIMDKNLSLPYLTSQLQEEKGMGSSTADITTVILATALQANIKPSYEEIAVIATSIEPTNSSFFNSTKVFNYINGNIVDDFGMLPNLKIITFDTGVLINTELFNAQSKLHKLYKQNEAITEEALYWFKKGLSTNNYNLLGKGSSMSAIAHQSILYKPELEPLYHIGHKFNSYGVINAHSGSLLGLIFPNNFNQLSALLNEVFINLPNINFIGSLNTYTGGLKYEKI